MIDVKIRQRRRELKAAERRDRMCKHKFHVDLHKAWMIERDIVAGTVPSSQRPELNKIARAMYTKEYNRWKKADIGFKKFTLKQAYERVYKQAARGQCNFPTPKDQHRKAELTKAKQRDNFATHPFHVEVHKAWMIERDIAAGSLGKDKRPELSKTALRMYRKEFRRWKKTENGHKLFTLKQAFDSVYRQAALEKPPKVMKYTSS